MIGFTYILICLSHQERQRRYYFENELLLVTDLHMAAVVTGSWFGREPQLRQNNLGVFQTNSL